MQQAMQQILVSTFLSKNWERKKIKLLITWTVIHSQWAFCIQLYISKTSYLIRNELDWCKNTGLLRSKVFTHVLVRLGQKQNACFSKWRRESYTLTAWCTAVNPDTGDQEEVFVLLENVETKESFHDERRKVSLQCYAATLFSFWKKIKILLEKKKKIYLHCILHFNIFNNLPCIQNQRNPGLLCPLWIRLWIQVEHCGGARKNLCWTCGLGLPAAAWSLGHGNLLFPDCVAEGCRKSQNSSVSLPPRLASAPC